MTTLPSIEIKWLSILLAFLLFAGCKKAFNPPGALSASARYLVIDGVINSGDSTFIKLSRTKIFGDTVVLDTERNAQVTIESNANENYPLSEISTGNYSAAPLNLITAHQYRLRIKTTDNKEYISDFVSVKNSPPIDSIGFNAPPDGLHIYVNTHDDSKTTQYYRWEYKENWQFHSWYFSHTMYPPMLGRNTSIYTCYTNNSSSSALIFTTAKLAKDLVYQAPILFIPSTSEKIETRYTILVKQYALTSDAYNYWQNLQKNTTQLGSIFDAQPSVNQTNYHCVSNPGEIVIGYLSVGATSLKRVFITADQLPVSYKLADAYGCSLYLAYKDHPPYWWDTGTIPGNMDYEVVDEIQGNSPDRKVPEMVTYTTRVCMDCTIRGTLTPPPYWR